MAPRALWSGSISFGLVNVPVRVPVLVGVNVILMVQLPEAARVEGLTGQFTLVNAKSPVIAKLLMVTAVPPGLVRVTLCAPLVVCRG